MTATEPVPAGGADRPAFDAVYAGLDGVQGWLTRGQAELLWATARRLTGPARIVEIGSYHGRSTIVLASAAGPGVEVCAIDPHGGNDRGPRQLDGTAEEGRRDHEAFLRNLDWAGVGDRVRHIRKPSRDATGDVPGEPEVVYVDGAHRYLAARADIVRWGAKVAPGGTLLIHDSFSSIGVTGAILTTLAAGREFRYVGRSGSMTEYRREPVHGVARAGNAVAQLAQLPYFVRNVAFKLMIVMGLGGLTARLGGTGHWPY